MINSRTKILSIFIALLLIIPSIAAIAAAPVSGNDPTILISGGSPSGVYRVNKSTWLITDTYNKVVWRVSGKRVEIYAGRVGIPDLSGEPAGGRTDGDILKAEFMSPWAIAPYKSGYLVTDTKSNSLRYIDGKTVSTIADKLSMPTGIAADGTGNVYFSETNSHRIMKMNASGTITNFAGGGAGYADGDSVTAKFREPTGLCWSGGALYVADSGNHAVRKIADGKVTTVAGKVFAADTDAFYGGGYIDGSVTDAEFSLPQGVSAANGAVYVADSGNGAVRVIRNGTVSTLANDLVSPRGLWADGTLLYVTDDFTGDVHRMLLVDSMPDKNISRMDLVSIIAELYKKQNPGAVIDGKEGFSDADTPAVRWAAENGVISGVGGGLFKPDDTVSFEMLIKILYNLYSSSMDIVPDVQYSVSPWANKAAAWAVSKGLIRISQLENSKRNADTDEVERVLIAILSL